MNFLAAVEWLAVSRNYPFHGSVRPAMSMQVFGLFIDAMLVSLFKCGLPGWDIFARV